MKRLSKNCVRGSCWASRSRNSQACTFGRRANASSVGVPSRRCARSKASIPSFELQQRTPERGISLDALALIKASQAISAEREAERLFEQILRVVAEVVGAQNGALLLCDDEPLSIRARIATTDGVSVSVAQAPLDNRADLPLAILRYVLRAREPLVLSDAAAEGAFTTDPAVRRRKIRSVLCVPLTSQAKVIGLLYLENDGLAGAFTPDSVEIVKILVTRAAISLENSTLVEALQRLTRTARERANTTASRRDRRTRQGGSGAQAGAEDGGDGEAAWCTTSTICSRRSWAASTCFSARAWVESASNG